MTSFLSPTAHVQVWLRKQPGFRLSGGLNTKLKFVVQEISQTLLLRKLALRKHIINEGLSKAPSRRP